MRPAANGSGRSKSHPRPSPSSGISVYWSATPGSTLVRSRPMRRKSSKPTVIPMLSMMIPSPIGIRGPLNQVKSSGRTSAAPLASSSQSGKALVTAARTGNVRALYGSGG